MTTERQREANRKNARKSSGPRSKRGKDRARRNALRHGLSLEPDRVPELRDWIESFLRLVAERHGGSSDIMGAAREVAAAFCEHKRMRDVRTQMLRTKADDKWLGWGDLPPREFQLVRWALEDRLSKGQPLAVRQIPRPYVEWPDEVRAVVTSLIQRADARAPGVRRTAWLASVVPELIKLERYERRADSRLKQALRDFDAAVAADATP